MKLFFMILMFACVSSFGGTAFVYQYDAQHRLVAVDYSEAQTDTQVSYQYDAANNLDLEVSITDGAHLKSFLLWLAFTQSSENTLNWLQMLKG